MHPAIEALPADLRAYLGSLKGVPAAWGAADCARMLAGWVKARTGRDPSAGWLYHDEASAKALVEGVGGLAELFRLAAERTRLRPTANPRVGDVGVILPQSRRGGTVAVELGAICIGDLWAVRVEGGVAGTKAAGVVAAWSVP